MIGGRRLSPAVKPLRRPEFLQRNLRSIVGRISPAVESLVAAGGTAGGGRDPEALLRDAVRANVHYATDQLRHGSEILERLIGQDGLMVVGAEYSLETGIVEFFEDA